MLPAKYKQVWDLYKTAADKLNDWDSSWIISAACLTCQNSFHSIKYQCQDAVGKIQTSTVLSKQKSTCLPVAKCYQQNGNMSEISKKTAGNSSCWQICYQLYQFVKFLRIFWGKNCTNSSNSLMPRCSSKIQSSATLFKTATHRPVYQVYWFCKNSQNVILNQHIMIFL